MAMIQCPKCGQEVSDKAMKCVHCGLILKSNSKDRIEKTPQELYDEACKYYKDLQLIVRKLGLVLESTDGLNFSTTDALLKMDLALQYILLIQAVSDGEVDHFEQQFINLITEHGNLLGLLNERYNTNCTWDSLEIYNSKTIYTMLIGLAPDFCNLTSDFIVGMAVVDAIIKDHDYYADIRNDFLNIAGCLAGIDKDVCDNKGDELFDKLFGTQYLKIKREFEQEFLK